MSFEIPATPESGFLDYESVYAVTNRLIEANVKFGVYSGSHAALLGGHRQPKDIDIWFDYEQIDQVCALFPGATIHDRRGNDTEAQYDGVMLNFGSEETTQVQAMSGTFTYADGIRYPLRWDEQVGSHTRLQCHGGLSTYFVDPVETVVFKAILQRSEAQGKSDISDILAIARKVELNMPYLFWRICESRSWSRVVPLLGKLDIITLGDIEQYRTLYKV